MSELTQSMGMLRAQFPSCIQQIDNPTYNGQPNPVHGHYFIVGSIPGECYDQERRKSKIYPTAADAISALKSAGVTRFQMPDCSWMAV